MDHKGIKTAEKGKRGESRFCQGWILEMIARKIELMEMCNVIIGYLIEKLLILQMPLLKRLYCVVYTAQKLLLLVMSCSKHGAAVSEVVD